MDIALARVDDRLIHGQVVTAWLQHIGHCDEILVCDDKARKDQFLQQVLMMTKPPDKDLRVLSVDETIQDFKDKANDSRKVLLITRGPEQMLTLLQNGVEFDYLNLGGMGGGPGRTKLHKNISATDEEVETLRQIQAMGVKVELKMIPSDPAVDLASIGGR
jgi:mannose/fructose/N-acetylgalactosamine-specific phosphotransferase system component IIB